MTGWVFGDYLKFDDRVSIPLAVLPCEDSKMVAEPFVQVWECLQARENAVKHAGCPLDLYLREDAASIRKQSFEKGSMLWRSWAQESILVLHGQENGLYELYPRPTSESLCADWELPSGCPTPIPEFGAIWCAQELIRSDLKKATECERDYAVAVQLFEKVTMFRVKNGPIYVIWGMKSGSRWERFEGK